MKRKLFSLISLILVFCMVFSTLVACNQSSGNDETTNTTAAESKPDRTETTSSETTISPVESTNESSSETTEKESDEATTESTVTGGEETSESSGSSESNESSTSEQESTSTEDEETTTAASSGNEVIDNANALANGVQAYFPTADRTYFTFENHEMILNYALSSRYDQQVESLKNKNGLSYIENTMDVFVTMENDMTYYASRSTASTTANIFRFGYYFYEMRLENQVFIDTFKESNFNKISYNKIYKATDIADYKMVERVLHVENSIDGNDPHLEFGSSYYGINQSASSFNYIKLTLKADGATATNGSFFIIAGDYTSYTEKQQAPFTVINDNEVHEYYIPLQTVEGYEGTLKSLRLDISGTGAKYEIHDLRLVYIDTGDAPDTLALNRSFNVYSDKMHHTVQIAATQKTSGIKTVGMKTVIDANTVDAVVVEDANGIRYSFDGVDWASAKYVGFSIKGVGVFGYILPYDGSGGTIEVTLSDGVYTIIQSKIPENGTILPSRGEYDDKKGYYTSVVAHNANDFFMSQRIYTDSNSDFTEFLYEAYCEINPLSIKNVSISSSSSSSEYLGYDPARGIYVFTVEGSSFNTAYFNNPNKHYNVSFSMRGDKVDRKIYMMTYTTSGALESAVILDKDKLLLPIPVEVGKNFSEAAGERNLFNVNDETYGEAIFPMVVKAGERSQYTVINLYQRWGNFPLKQLSWIQFSSPYYHLSTGVTESNCILPWYTTQNSKSLYTLPDFRSMSAPLWEAQPQHNSCGSHQWLIYTDADHNRVTSENISDYIDSYGPIYADVKMDNISDDGKIKITYVHTEMPQLDENRTYYEIRYEVLEDVTINDFRNNFQFYSVYPNNPTGYYKTIGYLDENNNYAYADAIIKYKDESGATVTPEPKSYVLGKECPYFSFFDMDNADPNHQQGYANVAFLIYSSDFIIGGEKIDPSFIITNSGDRKIKLSLDLGNVALKAGDTFSINAILLPWGSQELDRDYIDPTKPDPDAVYYDTVINEATGEKYLDKNVRDVRENTLLNPVKITADKDCETIESVFMPKLKTANRSSAEFTVSGGQNNIAVRVYGFDKLTAPKVEEYVNGNWVEYTLNSSKNPDKPGYIHYYDGYSVHYDGDGTFSYAFIITMENGAPRKFRINASESFTGWPSEPDVDEKREDHLAVFVDPQEINDALINSWCVSKTVISEDQTYVSLYGTGPDAVNHVGNPVVEGYVGAYRVDVDAPESGHIMVLKYRIPKTNSKAITKFEFFTSTTGVAASSSNLIITDLIVSDGEWHILAIDLSKVNSDNFKKEFAPATDGKYYAQFIRFDFFSQCMGVEDYIDLAFIGMDDSVEDIRNYVVEDVNNTVEKITVISGNDLITVDVGSGKESSTAAPKLESFIHPDCTDYTVTDLEYAACVDGVNGKTLPGGANTLLMSTKDINDSPITLALNSNTIASSSVANWATHMGPYLVVSGWVVVDGGVNKYVYSVDGGKTWQDCSPFARTIDNVSNDHLTNAAKRIGYKDANGNVTSGHSFTSDDDKRRGLFQGLNATSPTGIAADLTDHIGETVHVIFAAVPEKDTSTLCLIAYITGVSVVADEEAVTGPIYNEYVKEGSGYSVSTLQYAACIDRINTTKFGSHVNSNSTTVPSLAFNSFPIANYGSANNTTTAGNHLVFAGWAVVRGGIQKYVWSADGGLTWQEIELYGRAAPETVTNNILSSNRVQNLGYTFSENTDGANSMFQGPSDFSVVKGLSANLSSYSGQTVDVIFAAVPKADTQTLCLICVATGVSVP